LPTRLLGGASFSLRRVESVMFQWHGWHEPYESRGSRPDLWGTGGENPPVYPARVLPRFDFWALEVMRSSGYIYFDNVRIAIN